MTIKKGDQFYLGQPTVLWCKCTGVNERGWLSFFVINGCWNGRLDMETFVITHKFGSYQGTKPVWVGKAPFGEDRYNAAIAWIEGQLRGEANP